MPFKQPYRSQYQKEWYQKNKERLSKKTHIQHLLRTHGLTIAMHDQMKIKQSNKCELCGNEPKLKRQLCVDHCHKTNRVRALLCDRCNTTIGQMEESIELFEKAILYLKKYQIDPNTGLPTQSMSLNDDI